MGCFQSREADVGPGDDGTHRQVSDSDLASVETLFFDLDDTLYQNNWATATRLKDSISKYTTDKLGLSKDEAYELYLEHGTALRGLLKNNLIEDDQVEDFLHEVHDVSLEEVKPRPQLREMILKLGHKRRYIFTASIREHAEKCLKIIGIEDLFLDIIDCRTVSLQTKHDPNSFAMAMDAAGETDPKKCILFDDSTKNMKTANQMGFKTCLVGLYARDSGKEIVCPEADFKVDNLLELPTIMPALFQSGIRKSTSKTAAIGTALSPTAEQDVGSAAPSSQDRRMIVVLGGPGSGKGSQCARILKDFDGVVHLSAGDLLREEVKNPDSANGQLISECIKEGKLVPSEMTMRLIVQAMNKSEHKIFLIDGCPRDQDNLDNFNKHIVHKGEARLVGVLFYECTEDAMLERILKRGETSGRTDDNVESAKKRFHTFNNSTVPVVEHYKTQDLVYNIDAVRVIEDVYADTKRVLTVVLNGTVDKPASKARKSIVLDKKTRESIKLSEQD